MVAEDNADLRLGQRAYEFGLLTKIDMMLSTSGTLSRPAEELKELWVKPQKQEEALGLRNHTLGQRLVPIVETSRLGYGDIQAILAGLGRDVFPIQENWKW